MVMRSATVIVTRSAAPMITVGVVGAMRHTICMDGNFPVLESMGGVGNSQKRQTRQP